MNYDNDLRDGAGENAPLKSNDDFERRPHLPTIRRQLDAMRAKHGADSPIGHRCSNLKEQLGNLFGATGQRKLDLEKNIAESVADLAKLSAKPESAA